MNNMKKLKITGTALALCLTFLAISTLGQANRETYTGTILSYGSGFNTRAVTSTFTINIKDETPTDRAMHFLDLLQDKGQDALLDGIRDDDRGSFSVDGHLAKTINAVRERNVDGMRRIYIVFERWTRFAELRGGYRSLDYPFGYIELNIDPATGKGDGTYIAAAKISWKEDKGANGSHVEVEDFATFPARLLNVRVSYSKP